MLSGKYDALMVLHSRVKRRSERRLLIENLSHSWKGKRDKQIAQRLYFPELDWHNFISKVLNAESLFFQGICIGIV